LASVSEQNLLWTKNGRAHRKKRCPEKAGSKREKKSTKKEFSEPAKKPGVQSRGGGVITGGGGGGLPRRERKGKYGWAYGPLSQLTKKEKTTTRGP